MKRKGAILVFIVIFLLQDYYCFGIIESPFVYLKKKTLSFFSSLTGKVIKIQDNIVLINLGTQNRIVKGMRFDIFRKGEPFYHPVTGEIIGNIEKFIGNIEVKKVKSKEAICLVLQGKPQIGDIIRVSKRQRRILFYQDESVDYYLGDAYYKELKKSDEIEIVDAPIEPMDKKKLIALAKEYNTTAIIAISSSSETGKTVLKQTLMWKDGSVISIDKIKIPTEILLNLKKDVDIFFDITEKEALLTYILPFNAENIVLADINGDKKLELILTNSTDIYICKKDVDLSVEFKIKLSSMEEILWLDAADIDQDGIDEIFITTITDNKDNVFSYIYKIKGNTIKTLWKTKGFLRVINGEIFYQEYSSMYGYKGNIKKVLYDYDKGNFWIRTDLKSFPKNMNIYGFSPINSINDKHYYIYIDDNNYLNLIDSNGEILWQSSKKIEGYKKVYEKESFTFMVEGGKWYVKNRIINKGNKVFVVIKEPFVKNIKSIGYKKSHLSIYWISSGVLKQSVIIKNIPGEILDYEIFDNKVAILNKPLFGLKVTNILEGKNPFVTYLQIYSIRAERY